MTQEEKQLINVILLSLLPYNTKVAVDFKSYLEWLPRDNCLEYPYRKNLNTILNYEKKTIEDISKEPNILYAYLCKERFQMLRGYTYQEDYGVHVKFIKPYLRPMSSMTDEEKGQTRDFWIDADTRTFAIRLIDFYNKNHFDYRGLIPKGLALEATEGMYNT